MRCTCLASAERDELAAEVESWKRRMVPEEEGRIARQSAPTGRRLRLPRTTLDWLNEEPSLLAGSMNHHDEEEEEEEGSDADDDNYDQEGGEDEEEEERSGHGRESQRARSRLLPPTMQKRARKVRRSRCIPAEQITRHH